MIRRMCKALDLTYFMRNGYLVVTSIRIVELANLFIEALPNCALVTTRVVRYLTFLRSTILSLRLIYLDFT